VLRRAHAAVLADGASPVRLRELIRTSWQRALDAGVDPEHHHPPLEFATDDVPELRASHPLAAVIPLLRHVLGGIVAADAQQVLVVSDADGHVLWLEGHPRVKLMAEAISFVEGVRWTESTAGTNAVGTAIALDHAVQVFSAEHLVRVQHDWTCAAAPIHDPEDGALLVIVDISCPITTAHPHNLALVTAAAELAEEALRHAMHERHERMKASFLDLLAADGGAAALLSAQGRVLLARPAGWLGERLEVREALRGPRPASALAAYPGPLLERSQAPGIAAARDELEGALRRCALDALGPELLWAWVRTESGAGDLAAFDALAERLRMSDPRRAQALAAAERLRREYAV
jgi:transcriptional regulator of acetoin/glycerol metabolism